MNGLIHLLLIDIFVLMSMKVSRRRGTCRFLCHRGVVSDRLSTRYMPAPCTMPESCLTNTKVWMDNNRLRMNETKTEFTCYGSRQELSRCKTISIDVSRITVDGATSIKYLGVDLDQELSRIKRICRNGMYNMFGIPQIRTSQWMHGRRLFWDLQWTILQKETAQDAECGG